jgi:hypothetical protein
VIAKKYKASPVICEAFRLEFDWDKHHRWIRALPEWFQRLYLSGDVLITNSDQHGKYAHIKKQSGHIRVPEGSWIIKANEKHIFVMSNEEFIQHFTLQDD